MTEELPIVRLVESTTSHLPGKWSASRLLEARAELTQAYMDWLDKGDPGHPMGTQLQLYSCDARALQRAMFKAAGLMATFTFGIPVSILVPTINLRRQAWVDHFLAGGLPQDFKMPGVQV